MFSLAELGFFEKLMEMSEGFVLDFSNGTFSTFVADSIGIDIYSDEYKYKVENKFGSSSKANILRYILRNEDEKLVLKLINDLVEYYEFSYFYGCDEHLLLRAKDILKKYNSNTLIDEDSSEDRIIDLIREINKSSSEGKPIFALDRSHTLVQNKLREICTFHGIEFEKKDNIDQLLKKYLNFIEEFYHFNSAMSKSILKQSISLFSEFNHVRNNMSYAHDNPVLNQEESLLIFKNIVNTLNFISSIDEYFKL